MKKKIISTRSRRYDGGYVTRGMFGKGGLHGRSHVPGLLPVVAAMVSQKAASLSNTYSDKIILVADAVKGDAATVNSWVAGNESKRSGTRFRSVRDFSPSPPFLIRQRCSSLTMISSLLKTCIHPFSLCLLIPSSISRILMI